MNSVLIKKLFSSCLLLLFVLCAKAQLNTCGHELIMSLFSEEANGQEIPEEVVSSQGVRGIINRITFRAEIIIPVIFHVVWLRPEENIPEEILVQQIQILNDDFNALNSNVHNIPDEFLPHVGNANIRFCLASEDPAGKPTKGIVRVKTNVPHVASPYVDSIFFTAKGGSDAWDTEKYLNVWVASTGSIAAGYASLPWFVPKNKVGVVIDPLNLIDFHSDDSLVWKKRVLVHEIGHYLGLDHLWGYDMYGRPTCTYDDGIEDTPRQRTPHRGCPEYPQITCESSDMTMNFMNYTSDQCMYMFTKGQVARMHQILMLYYPDLGRGSTPCIDLNTSRELERTSMNIWPNPAKTKSRIYVEFSKNVAEAGNVEVWDLYGRRIFRRFFILRNQMELELPYLSPGTYVLKIGSSLGKFIVAE